MEPRARRLVIRERLNQARAALDAGDRARALAAVNAALEIDPDYLAAQALKDTIDRSTHVAWSVGPKSDLISAETKQVRAEGSSDRRPVLPAEPPTVSAEGWARFEHRAKNRRIERRVAAARLAIQKRRFAEAQAILQEIGEIDSDHPDLISLGIELDAGLHLARAPRRFWGPAVAALLIFAAVIFGARYLQSPEWTSGVPVVAQPASGTIRGSMGAGVGVPVDTTTAAAPDSPALPNIARAPEPGNGGEPAQTPAPALDRPSTQEAPAAAPAPSQSIGPLARAENSQADPRPQARDDVPVQARERIVWPPVVQQATTLPPPAQAPAPEEPFTPPAPPALAPAVAAAALPGTVAPAPSDAVASRIVPRDPDTDRARSAAVAVMNVPRDEDLVRRTLQQYRAAYDNLDAQSAHAVWPTVSETALQRAFSGLESQQLNFDDCDVQVRGTTGLATCRGTMLYVPKVGSHDPRREPRVWTFDLRKVGESWQIDNARTAR